MTVHVTNVADPIAANVDSIPVSSYAPRHGIYRFGLKRVLDLTLVLLAAPVAGVFAVSGVALGVAWGIAGRLHLRLGAARMAPVGIDPDLKLGSPAPVQ